MTGSDHDRYEPVGEKGVVMPKGGILTCEVLATCLAIAWGGLEYLPVLAAACQHIVGGENLMLTSSISAYPGILVNCPVANQSVSVQVLGCLAQPVL